MFVYPENEIWWLRGGVCDKNILLLHKNLLSINI